MKILTVLSIGLVISLAGCNLISNTSNVKGSGNVKTEKRSVASFDSLDANYVGSIQVRSQGQESLEISGDDNIIPLITTEVKNGTLYIRPTKGYNPQQKLQIIVSTPDLKKFVFDGVGKANLSNVKNDRLEIVVNGVGDFTASGETKEADITLSGVGSLDAKNLHTVNAKVNSTGVGNVDIYVTGQLDAQASGVGKINYYGSPKIVNRQAEGIGKINER
ncbi:head GIN domain-containing protein [Microcoleus sp. A006_D1]|uniref:head GIN domain-containing protein n=1 Tax=Microcoleus sp. A006_D1 TaxID=3055267 RepID=UPI002FD509CF